MANLIRWDPFSEFSSLRRAMNNVFDDFVPMRSYGSGEGGELTFPIDLSEDEENVTLKAVLPGIEPDNVDISVSEGVLTIKGQTKQEQKTERENYYRQEIRYGAFSRSIALPSRVNHDQAEAEFQDGILTVTLPKAEDVKPRPIKIRPHGSQKELVGTASQGSDGSAQS